MATFSVRAALAAALSLSSTALAAAAQTPPGCTDDSRECMIRAVNSYYDAMQAHDGSLAWLAPDVKRTLIGLPPGSGEDRAMHGAVTIRASLDRAPAQIHLDHRYWIDEDANMVNALMLTSLKERTESIHVSERFKVEKGLIKEIEAIFYRDTTTATGKTGWPPGEH